jgi:pyruvate dehydrogenase phosphatase
MVEFSVSWNQPEVGRKSVASRLRCSLDIAIGDAWLKIPSIYTSRIFSQLEQDWITSSKLHEYSQRINSPPYVSNRPDIYHRTLPDSPCFLILCSDGLRSSDVYEELQNRHIPDRWVQVIGQTAESQVQPANLALALLRDALGGQDILRVSRNITVEMDEQWVDDISIIVIRKDV